MLFKHNKEKDISCTYNATYHGREPSLSISSQLDIRFPSSINVTILIKLVFAVMSSIVVIILKETESSSIDGNMDIHCRISNQL